MTREKFQRKQYFSMKKRVGSTLDIIHKSSFFIGQVPGEKYVLKTMLFKGEGGGGGERCRNAQKHFIIKTY